MADQEDEELRMALRMSLHSPTTPPEAKRSKPRENNVVEEDKEQVQETPEAKSRRLQRELMAAAAEKRMSMFKSSPVVKKTEKKNLAVPVVKNDSVTAQMSDVVGEVEKMDVSPRKSQPHPLVVEQEKKKDLDLGKGRLTIAECNQLFSMLFGDHVSSEILAQWTNQGIRFSSDPETCMGLVQLEGGPCGVLATIQAFVLKYLLFIPDELGNKTTNLASQNLGPSRYSQSDFVTLGNFASLTEDGKARALVRSMVEILFMCGSKGRAVITTLNVFDSNFGGSNDSQNDEIIAKTLEGLPFASASDMQKVLRVEVYTSHVGAFHYLMAALPLFRSRLGAILFLISALLSRGLEAVQADRDDPSLPLVTAPFGHASQEIVNLLLCGEAVANVFDGRMDLGAGMFLKGISSPVEVGFLTLLESLNFCKVGQHLKCPKWPIWVIGSESHYTVLFAFDPSVQHENELEKRESDIRNAFNAQDQSGGGGFISVEGLQQVVRQTGIELTQEKFENLSSMGFIVWSEFWAVLLELDRSLGGMKDSSGMLGRKVFDLYHFNGIAKSVLGGSGEGQRPRLSKLRVSVPPRWSPEEFMSGGGGGGGDGGLVEVEVMQVEAVEVPQHAPLVDCVRTRWPRAVCNWVGDAPSIV